MIKSISKRLLVGLGALIIVSVIIFSFDFDLRFHLKVAQNTKFEVFLFLICLLFLFSISTKNEKFQYVFESSFLFLLGYMFLITIIFFKDNRDDSLSWIVIIFSLIIFLAWIFTKKIPQKINIYLKPTLLIFLSFLLIDTCNMIWFISSLKQIDKIQYTDEIKNFDIDNAHYSIYSKIDTFNVSQSDFEYIEIPLPKEIQENLNNYDEIHINLELYFSPYLKMSKRDILNYNWIEKFYTEYLITQHTEGIYYLNKKTGELLDYSDIFSH